MRNQRKFTVVIERDEDGYYVGTVATLPGCHTQAKTLDTLMKRMREAVELCLESEPNAGRPLELVGVQQISI
jgi:predicted RNase H-like HicB family nuclease